MQFPRTSRALALALLAACSDASTGADGRRPIVSAVNPSSIVAGSGSVTIRVTGSRFVERSVVQVGPTRLATTFVNPGTLSAELDAATTSVPGPLTLVVVTDAPGGGTSDTLVVERVSAQPSVTGLDVDTVAVGINFRQFRVFGTGFSASSVVEFGGTALPTTYLSGTEVRFGLSSPSLSTVRRVAVRIRNPAPGGGLSPDSAVVSIIEPLPVLDPPLFPSITAGMPRTDIELSGRGFRSGQSIEWNGTTRLASSVTPTRIRFPLTALDVATPGTATIRVVAPANDIQPERYSDPIAVTVRALGATTVSSTTSVPLVARRVIWDPNASLFITAAASEGGEFANRIARFDPSGTFVDSLSLGTEPVDLALSSDGAYLYVALQLPGRVHRVALPSFTRDLNFLVADRPYQVLPLAGEPRAVLVLKGPSVVSYPTAVAVYDDATRRPQEWTGSFLPTRVTPGDVPGRFFGSETWTSNRSFYEFSVTATGVGGAQITPMPRDIPRPVAVGNKVYHVTGRMDVSTREVDIDWEAGFFAVDRIAGRVYRIREGHIEIRDAWSGIKIGEIPTSISLFDLGERSEIIRWGSDGLALLTLEHLVILRSPAAAP